MAMQSALDVVDFNASPFFSAREWPSADALGGVNVLKHMTPGIIRTLFDLRASVPEDHRMHPSPAWGAHVRPYGDSRHSISWDGTPRLSDATDFFMDWEHVFYAWEQAQRIKEIGGLGIYFDTKLGGALTPMLHIDNRPERLLWVRYTEMTKQRYIYHADNPAVFHSIMGRYADMYARGAR